MTHSDLRLLIQDIIRQSTGRELTVPIHIFDLEPQGYEIGIEIRQYDPSWITLEMPDDDVEEHLRRMLPREGMMKAVFAKAVRNTTVDHKLNDFRSPYDLERLNGKDE